MKVVLIGANGQLGSDLHKVFQAAGDTVVPLVRAQLDVRSTETVFKVFAETTPDVVINTAAFHNVVECEAKPDVAFQVNATAAMGVAQACHRVGATLVHFSTDYAFGGEGKTTPYEEEDRPAPLNVYGVSKVAGEHLIRAHTDRHFVVRVCGLYGVAGSSGKGGNFVENMLKKALAGQEIQVVNDQIVTPTYTVDLAEAVRRLVLTGKFGLYHLSAEGQCSWYEFARRIFEAAGVRASLSPALTDHQRGGLKRPAYSVLSKAKLRALGLSMPSWENALVRFLSERSRIPAIPASSGPSTAHVRT